MSHLRSRRTVGEGVEPLVKSQVSIATTDLTRELVRYFRMTRDRFDLSGVGITPKRVFAAFPLQKAARACGDVSATNHASLQDDRFSNGILGNTAQRVFSAVFKDNLNCFSQILETLLGGSALTVGARNFRTICDEPVFVFLDDCRELIVHDIPQPRLASLLHSKLEVITTTRHGGAGIANGTDPQTSYEISGITDNESLSSLLILPRDAIPAQAIDCGNESASN